MNFRNKVTSAIQSAISTKFNSSTEGSTGSGTHELAVSKHFEECGFLLIEKSVSKSTVSFYKRGPNKDKEKPQGKVLVMDKVTHSPTKDIEIPYEDGCYQIVQPYQLTTRGSFNPAPDMYLVCVENKAIVDWIGIECKSSKTMRPTWNDNLPRPFKEGNILYLFTGTYQKETYNCIFTNEIFFQGKDYQKITTLYENARKFLEEEWKRMNCHEEFPDLSASFRIKCEQKNNFTPEMIKDYNEKTLMFLRNM